MIFSSTASGVVPCLSASSIVACRYQNFSRSRPSNIFSIFNLSCAISFVFRVGNVAEAVRDDPEADFVGEDFFDEDEDTVLGGAGGAGEIWLASSLSFAF